MILEDVAARLDQLAELTIGTNLFMNRMPSMPDTCVTVYEYPGMDPVTALGNDLPKIERPRVQIAARSKRYADARELIDKVFRSLCTVVGEELTAGVKTTMEPLQSPFSQGRDDSDRVLLAVNFQVHRDYV